MVQIDLEQDFAISQLVSKLTGKECSWPENFFDIVFKKNTPEQPARIYYYETKNDSQPPIVNKKENKYLNGYNLEAAVDLTLLETKQLLLKVNIATNKGMEAHVALADQINIFVLELAGKNKGTDKHKKYINGPDLYLNTKITPNVFGFTTGLNFFEYPFGTADIAIGRKKLNKGKTEPKLNAKLTADKAIPIFGNLTVDISYCRSEGLTVNNWPDFSQVYESVEKVIDIADELSKIMKLADPTLVCGEIVDFVADVAYENKFTMTPSFSTKGNDKGGFTLYLVLNGTFEVHVVEQKVTSIAFPNSIMIPLPRGTSFDNLEEKIKDAISSSAASFVKGLIVNKEQWAKLVTIIFVEQAGQLATQMLCEGLIESLTAESIIAGSAAVMTAGGAAVIIADGAAAAAAVASGVAAATAIFTSCFTAGTEVIMANGSTKAIEDVAIGDKILGKDNVINEVLAYDRPKLGSRKLYAINDGPYFITSEHPLLTKAGWKAINPKKTNEENPYLKVGLLTIGDVLLTSNGKNITVKKIAAKAELSHTQLYNFKLDGNNTYFANGYIAHNKGGGGGSHHKPGKPALQSVEYKIESEEIITSWEPEQYASNYKYKILKPDGSALDEQTLTFTETRTTTSVRGKKLAAGIYKAMLCAKRKDFQSKWDMKLIEKLPAVKSVKLGYDRKSEFMQLNWAATVAPAGYYVEIFCGTDIIWQQNVTTNTLDIDPGFMPVGTISAKVIVSGNKNHIQSSSADSENKLPKPTIPLNVVAAKDNGNIKISWKQQPKAGVFDVILFKNGNVFKKSESQSGYAEFDGDTLTGGLYTAKVRKSGSSTQLPSNYTATTNNIKKLSMPVNIIFQYNNKTGCLDISWDNIENNNGYKIIIADSSDLNNIAYEETIAKDVTNKSVQLLEFINYYQSYTASVQTLETRMIWQVCLLKVINIFLKFIVLKK